jgi:hypothetical protein
MEFKVGDVVRPIAVRDYPARIGLNGVPQDGRVTIAMITGSPNGRYGYWFHTNAKNPTGPWRDLTLYEKVNP